MASLAAKAVPSFGFSGAGFLTCYHLGVAECLLKHGKLLAPGELPKDDEGTHEAPIMTGVSGGALVATAVSLGIRPEDGMKATMAIAEHTRKAGGLLDHLRPGSVHWIVICTITVPHKILTSHETLVFLPDSR